MTEQIATIVERKGGETIQVGDFRVTVNEKLKLDKVIYNDILARRGLDAMQNNLTEAQYVDKFGTSPEEYQTAKSRAVVALQHIVPDQFRISVETDMHIKLNELLDDLKKDLDMAENIGDINKVRETYRKALNDTINYMKAIGLSSNQSGDKFAQAQEVISILVNFILREKEESKKYSVECPYCSKKFMADVSDKYTRRMISVHERIKGYEIMDVEAEEV